MKLYETILIIGGGLIGSSLAWACKEHKAAGTVLITDKDAAVRNSLLSLAIADDVPENAPASAAKADLVILAVPPGAMSAAASEIARHMKPGAVLTDVGSIKASIVDSITPLMQDGVEFIGGHPIAGTENSGPEAGFASLFNDRWCILTPKDEESANAQKLKQFWECLGSEVAFMEPKHHDLVLATTSHLPHLIAYGLVGTATDMETVTKGEVVKYSAAGFRDFTRIAASNPVMWRDVFLGNREAVLEVLGRYIEDLTALKRAIRWGDGDTLMREFSKTRDIRKRIIDAGQDNAAPNFGRDEQDD